MERSKMSNFGEIRFITYTENGHAMNGAKALNQIARLSPGNEVIIKKIADDFAISGVEKGLTQEQILVEAIAAFFIAALPHE